MRDLKKRRKLVLVALTVFFIATATACSDAENHEESKEESGAQLIDDSNRSLIGTQGHGNAVVYPAESDPVASGAGTNLNVWDTLAESGVLTGPADSSVVPPGSVVEFAASDGKTPEIILSNADCAVFSQGEGIGWDCEPGDRLEFSFEKYPAEIVSDQTLLIGRIQNGLFYEGEAFTDLSGSYCLDIQEAGEYFVYVMSATSDYLALKNGEIAFT